MAKPTPAPDDFDRAQAHALDCATAIFPPKLLDALVSAIPEPPFEFQDAHSVEQVIEHVRRCRTAADLKRFVDERAVLWELIVVAWAFHTVIQQVQEARVNGAETPFGRYKDLLSEPSAPAVCLSGLAYLKFVWRG